MAGPLRGAVEHSRLAVRQDATTPVPLRIMSVGASVTFGVGSTTGDSYRKDLRDLLTADGVGFTSKDTVNFVGTRQNGKDFTDNQVEATSGFVISQIANATAAAAPQFLPNLVLVDAGTNNCNSGKAVPDAGAQVEAMIRDVYDKSPGSTVVMTTVLVNSKENQDACRRDVNDQYFALAEKLQAEGAKFVLVDMRSAAGPTVSDLADGRHPNDGGYVKMANVFFEGIKEAATKGFLTPPADNDISLDGNAAA
jgi:lysophospholipase L1-like esterase